MRLDIRPRELMKMGNELVDKVKANSAGKDSRNRYKQAIFSSVFKRGNDEANHRSRKHHRHREAAEVLREAAVSCYSVEGMYPPNLEYLEKHYGVQIDRRHFIVRYTAIAENLMPDITVLDK